MDAIRVNTLVKTDGEICVTGLPYKKGEQVELILLPLADLRAARAPLTARQLRHSDLIGLWKDHADIQDNIAYARQLRDRAQRRAR